MRTSLALLLLAILAGQQVAAVQSGTRSSRKLLQENRIGTGAGNILDAAGADSAGADVTNVSDADDGDLTNDLAAAGTDAGNAMLDTLPAAGSDVPGRRRLLQPGGGGPGGPGGGGAGGGGSSTGSLPIVSDLTGDASQTAQEGEQLTTDTTTLGASNGRKLLQNAGTGAGLDAIFSDFDTSTGEGTENAEDNIANDISGHSVTGTGGGASGGPGGPGGPGKKLLQNAGTGAGLDAIFSDFDTSTGEGTENAEDNIAQDLSGNAANAGQGTGGPGGPGKKLLQENRIGTGAGNILDAAGADSAGADVTNVSDADDGDLTNDLAAAGTDAGNAMLDTLPAAGSDVPGRRRLLQGGGGSLPVAGDLTGDVQQTAQEAEQLVGDTTSNLGAGGGAGSTTLPNGL